MRILLLESDKLLAGNIASAFKRAGHTVDWQLEAQEAIAAADTNRPDVVVLDFFLAGHNGLEFLYEFRSYPDWSDVPAIIFSSLAEESAHGYLDELDRLGVKYFFYKPSTSLAQLVQAASQLVNITK